MDFNDYRHIIETKFWSKVDRSGPVHPILGTACWLWTGASNRSLYGQLTVRLDGCFYYIESAHRISYRLHFGHIAEDHQILHACDRPACVAPHHLSADTNVENIKDKVRKGRQPRGTQFAHAKLTEAKVAELLVLRAEGWSGPDLARRYGVTRENIAAIVKGKTWGHVEGPRESPPSHE